MRSWVWVALTLLLAACGSGSFTPAPAPSVFFASLGVPTPQFPAGITLPTGIVANYITATDVETGGATLGALYNQSTGAWTAVAYPAAASTAAYGPAITASGYRVVGSYKLPGAIYDSAFYYDSASNTFAAIAPVPLAYPATAHAFLYIPASGTYSLIDMPNAISTTAYGIWIDTDTAVAGGFTDAKGTHGYVRGLASNTIIAYDYPGAGITHFEGITGAGGAGNYNLAGNYSSATPGATVYGFWLPVRNWVFGTPIVLGAVSANSVYENTVVGVVPNGTSSTGYIATVP